MKEVRSWKDYFSILLGKIVIDGNRYIYAQFRPI